MSARMHGLSRKATIGALENDAKLSLVGIFSNCLLYILVCASSPDLASSSVIWLTHFSILIFTLSRALNIKLFKNLLRSRNGIIKQRAWYTFDTWILGLTWGWLTFYSLSHWGMGAATSVQLVMISGCLAAFVSASITFDLVPSLGYQAIVYSCLLSGFFFTGHWALVAGVVAAIIYGAVSSLNLHNSTIAMIKQSELIKKHIAQLRKNSEVIEAMHESLDESFILLNSDGLVTSQISSVARKFFPNIAPGAPLSQLLGKSGADAVKISQWFEVLYSDKLNFQEMAKRGPQILQLNDGPLALRLKFQPLRGEDGELRSIIFTATDVTAEAKAQRHLEEERERAALIVRIHQNRETFVQFLADFEKIVTKMRQQSERGEDQEAAAKETKRELHNLKGAALLFGLNSLAQRVYTSELAIGSGVESVSSQIAREGAALFSYFAAWRDAEMRLFIKLGVFEGDLIEVPKAKLRAIESELVAATDPHGQHLLEHFQIIKNKLLAFEFGDLLSGFEHLVNTVSERLGKKVCFTLVRPAEPLHVEPKDYRETVRTFVHVFNNCVDHGIEAPEERLRAGKPPIGQITVRYEKTSGTSGPGVRIEIEDDGRGIDIDRVRHKIRARGKINCDEMSDLEVASLVLTGEISTRDSVSDISGQGVGMGAVKAAIKRAGGTFQILRTGPKGTVFEITLPSAENKAKKKRAAQVS